MYLDLVYDLNRDIENLRNNISKKVPAGEKTMLARLDDIEKGIEERIEKTETNYKNKIEELKEIIVKQDDDIETINELNEDTRSILNLYIALTNATPFIGNDNVKIQNIKTIGYIVASYASKDNENKRLKEMD